MKTKVDAYKLLVSELAAYRGFRYEELVQFIGQPILRRVRANDSTDYAIEIAVVWRNHENGDVVVKGWVAVDDCGPMLRLDDWFVVSPS